MQFTICCQQVHLIVKVILVPQPAEHNAAAAPPMLTVWPLASWVAALKLWPALSRCTPPVRSVCLCVLDSAHLLRQASQNIFTSKTSLLALSLFNSLSFSSSQFLHCLSVSLSLCLSIYQSQLLSQLLGSHVSEGWKRCLTVKKNLQLCSILHLTGCCSCLRQSASAAASPKIFPPPHTNTCLLLGVLVVLV